MIAWVSHSKAVHNAYGQSVPLFTPRPQSIAKKP